MAAMAAAAAPSGRLPCAARLGLARRNSLRALRALQPKAALLGAADSAVTDSRLPLRAVWVALGTTEKRAGRSGKERER